MTRLSLLFLAVFASALAAAATTAASSSASHVPAHSVLAAPLSIVLSPDAPPLALPPTAPLRSLARTAPLRNTGVPLAPVELATLHSIATFLRKARLGQDARAAAAAATTTAAWEAAGSSTTPGAQLFASLVDFVSGLSPLNDDDDDHDSDDGSFDGIAGDDGSDSNDDGSILGYFFGHRGRGSGRKRAGASAVSPSIVPLSPPEPVPTGPWAASAAALVETLHGLHARGVRNATTLLGELFLLGIDGEAVYSPTTAVPKPAPSNAASTAAAAEPDSDSGVVSRVMGYLPAFIADRLSSSSGSGSGTAVASSNPGFVAPSRGAYRRITVTANYTLAEAFLAESASVGDADAHFLLGAMHSLGLVTTALTPTSPNTLTHTNAHSANSASASASASASSAAIVSAAVTQFAPEPAMATSALLREDLAVLHYTAAAMAGSPEAKLALGYKHLMGYGVPKSCDVAMQYYGEVAELTVTDLTASEHVPDPGLRASDAKARLANEVHSTLSYLLNLGYTSSQALLGGHGAADGGAGHGNSDPDGLRQIVEYHTQNLGRYSSDSNLKSFYTLGMIHLYGGRGVVRDVPRALSLLSHAARRGHEDAAGELALYLMRQRVPLPAALVRIVTRAVTPVSVHVRIAPHNWMYAARAHRPEAIASKEAAAAVLAKLPPLSPPLATAAALLALHGGSGVRRDLGFAHTALLAAAEAGYATARYHLANLYMEGPSSEEHDAKPPATATATATAATEAKPSTKQQQQQSSAVSSSGGGIGDIVEIDDHGTQEQRRINDDTINALVDSIIAKHGNKNNKNNNKKDTVMTTTKTTKNGNVEIKSMKVIEDDKVAAVDSASTSEQSYQKPSDIIADAQRSAHSQSSSRRPNFSVQRSYSTAFDLFTRAAQQGHMRALYNLAQLYLSGLGAPRSCDLGIKLLKTVAEAGPWTAVLTGGYAAARAGRGHEALVSYALGGELGYESAQANAAWLLDPVHAPGQIAGVARLGREASRAVAAAVTGAWMGWEAAVGAVVDTVTETVSDVVNKYILQQKQSTRNDGAAAETRKAAAKVKRGQIAAVAAAAAAASDKNEQQRRNFDFSTQSQPSDAFPAPATAADAHAIALVSPYYSPVPDTAASDSAVAHIAGSAAASPVSAAEAFGHALLTVADAPAHFAVPRALAPLHHLTVGAKLLRRAAEQGNIGALRTLGDWAFSGVGLSPGRADPRAAYGLYKAASELRDAEATFNLAAMYEHGWGHAGANGNVAAAHTANAQTTTTRPSKGVAANSAAHPAPVAAAAAAVVVVSSSESLLPGQDFALAKRYYDLAATQSAAAAVPVEVALWGLWARLTLRALKGWWETGADFTAAWGYVKSNFFPGPPQQQYHEHGNGQQQQVGTAAAAAAVAAEAEAARVNANNNNNAAPAAAPAAAAPAPAEVNRGGRNARQQNNNNNIARRDANRGARDDDSPMHVLQRWFRDVYLPNEDYILGALVGALLAVIMYFRNHV